jgi:glycosyltransferase involved in cell wall biosynthesis
MEKTTIDRHPGISVVIATFNSGKTLAKCLEKVREQDYPQSRIEILLGDGGSTDDTQAIAAKYGAEIIAIPAEIQNAEFNRGTAFNHAGRELVLILDHDNFMPSRNYLNELVQPMLEHPEVVAVESCYYHYDRSYSLLDRYYALFGTIEPVPFYFGKADRMMQTSKSWNLLGASEDCGNYYVVKFDNDPRKIPTIGTNGCLMRRELVMANADVRPEHHFPIDVMVDVIKSGHNTFAFVKNSLIHLTGARGLLAFLKRRVLFVEKYHFADQARRRYSVYMPGDEWKLVKFIFISLTLVKPTLDALRGFLVIRDPAWFVHPVMCIGITIAYGWGAVRSRFSGIRRNTA